MAFEIRRLPQVLASRGRSRSSHYTDIAGQLFTPPVKLGDRAVGWPAHELEALNAARVAGKTNDEIRQLVGRLVAARKTAA